MNQHRYQLERYRGRGSRYICPKCRHKHSFTRYIDTYNNIYINDSVGKCNRLDKCGYHYTPRQYFDDNPHLHDTDTYLHPWTDGHLHGQNDRPSTPNPHLFISHGRSVISWAKRPTVHSSCLPFLAISYSCSPALRLFCWRRVLCVDILFFCEKFCIFAN